MRALTRAALVALARISLGLDSMASMESMESATVCRACLGSRRLLSRRARASASPAFPALIAALRLSRPRSSTSILTFKIWAAVSPAVMISLLALCALVAPLVSAGPIAPRANGYARLNCPAVPANGGAPAPCNGFDAPYSVSEKALCASDRRRDEAGS